MCVCGVCQVNSLCDDDVECDLEEIQTSCDEHEGKRIVHALATGKHIHAHRSYCVFVITFVHWYQQLDVVPFLCMCICRCLLRIIIYTCHCFFFFLSCFVFLFSFSLQVFCCCSCCCFCLFL